MTLLSEYPPSFCGFCERDTMYDGWGRSVSPDGVAEIFCSDCGKKKAEWPIDDLSSALRDEMDETWEAMWEEVND